MQLVQWRTDPFVAATTTPRALLAVGAIISTLRLSRLVRTSTHIFIHNITMQLLSVLRRPINATDRTHLDLRACSARGMSCNDSLSYLLAQLFSSFQIDTKIVEVLYLPCHKHNMHTNMKDPSKSAFFSFLQATRRIERLDSTVRRDNKPLVYIPRYVDRHVFPSRYRPSVFPIGRTIPTIESLEWLVEGPTTVGCQTAGVRPFTA